MLDFTKLIEQIGQVGADSLTDSEEEHEKLLNASAAYDEAASVAEEFAERLKAEQQNVLWPLAFPLERFGNAYRMEIMRDPVTVVAVDGSQIMPSHHEVHACYLLNVGVVVITYGKTIAPILDSIPTLYHRPDHLYPLVDRRRIHIDELYVSLERTLLELSTLLEHSLQALERGANVVALFDGSLIAWSAEKLPESHQQHYFERLVQVMDGFRLSRIPLLGYLSYSRSSDVINALRVSVCPYESSRCRDLCGHLNEEEFPCSAVWPLTDRQLLVHKLNMQERSCVFQSGSTAARNLPEHHRICFSYLNTEFEVARLEFPQWLFADQALFKLACSTVITQSKKGMGYPVCLAEAHHLAVIRGHDRQQFFQLITRHLVETGVRRVRVSPKESKKRIGFI